MSDSVTVSVEVAVSPEVAFDVFTRDIDAWYRVDPDTLPDITRTAAIRFEPRVGGRLLDVHDLDTGEGREIGRVTAWEPGRSLVLTDNEGTEVEVTFQPDGGGTRVTLTHRGLDRLADPRARPDWTALAPFYRDHLAPRARPLALAIGFKALIFAIAGGLWLALRPEKGDASVWIFPVLLVVAIVAISSVEDRLVRRWLPSQWWQHRRVSAAVMVLVSLGLLIEAVYRVAPRGEDMTAIGLPLALLASFWHTAQVRPARGSPRARAARRTFAERHRDVWLFCLMAGVVAAAFGLSALPDRFAARFPPVVLLLLLAFWLRAIASKRRQRQALGFDPDFYLAVERRVDEHNRPELLFHQPSQQAEYSGWYAYASEQDVASGDLVAWSLKDLIDHFPEAVRPLREGDGIWSWDQARRTYSRAPATSGG